MAIRFKYQTRYHFGRKQKIRCPVVESRGMKYIDEVADQAALKSCCDPAMIKDAILTCTEVVAQYLEKGYRVNLGEMGTFGVRFRCRPQPDSETAYEIGKKYATFRAGVGIRKAVADAELTTM